MSNITMRGRDAISAKLAEVYATIGSNRYHLMQAIDFEGNFDKNKSAVPILGKTGTSNKSTGWKGTWKCTMHYKSSVFRELLRQYKETGEDTYFEIQVSNEDPTSAAGRQTIVFVDCNADGGILAKFDADGEYLDEEMSGTFEDFRMPETFTLLDGML